MLEVAPCTFTMVLNTASCPRPMACKVSLNKPCW
jgi:hypothetical protein